MCPTGSLLLVCGGPFNLSIKREYDFSMFDSLLGTDSWDFLVVYTVVHKHKLIIAPLRVHACRHVANSMPEAYMYAVETTNMCMSMITVTVEIFAAVNTCNSWMKETAKIKNSKI